MTNQPVKENKNDVIKMIVLTALLFILISIIAWHFILPLLGMAVAISASLWSIAVATVILICIATLLFFIFSGIGIFILGLFVFGWTILAIVFFPLLFPILVPILLLMLVVGLIARNKKAE